MNTGRKILADALKAALPNWQIVSDSRVIDSVRSPGACVAWGHEFKRVTRNGKSFLAETVDLYVLGYLTENSTKVEDTLEDELFQVLEVLEPLDSFTWDTITRTTFEDAYPAWKIELTCVFPINN